MQGPCWSPDQSRSLPSRDASIAIPTRGRRFQARPALMAGQKGHTRDQEATGLERAAEKQEETQCLKSNRSSGQLKTPAATPHVSFPGPSGGAEPNQAQLRACTSWARASGHAGWPQPAGKRGHGCRQPCLARPWQKGGIPSSIPPQCFPPQSSPISGSGPTHQELAQVAAMWLLKGSVG